jgi:hypothetical protein
MTNDEDFGPTIGFRRSSSVLRQAQSSTTNYCENTLSLFILSGFEVVVNSYRWLKLVFQPTQGTTRGTTMVV